MKAKQVKSILGITQQTIHNYMKLGKLKFTKINPYHTEYDDKSVYDLLGKPTKEKINITYSRVSLAKQKNDLTSQSERIYNFAISNGYKVSEQIEDIRSGMNFTDRKGLNLIISKVINGEIDTIIVENKDRLARFGFELIENFFKNFGTKILVTSDIENKSYEQELTEDLVSIIHHFSMKSYSNRRKLNKIKQDLLEPEI